jgi:uncharacterized membrane protein YphA (DoxX/SURF4 family)
MSNEAGARRALKLGYGLVPIVAGADKFTNILVDWEKYLSPQVARTLPVSKRTFMKLVGVVEIAAGTLVLSRRTRLGAFTVAAWLSAITGNLILDRDWDIAARDALLAVGAVALGLLSVDTVRKKERPPVVRQRPEGMAAILH